MLPRNDSAGRGALVALALLLAAATLASAPPPPGREDAYRANNLGVALLEQVKFAEAAQAFRRALQIEPGFELAQVNLAIALFNVPDLAGAQLEAQIALERSPSRPQPPYIAGLVAKAQNRPADAIASFERVLKLDPDDVGARVNLAQMFVQQQKYEEAVGLLRRAVEVEPYNTTAAYNLATALLRAGQSDDGQKEMKRFQDLREAGYATSFTQNYPLQGRHAEAIVSTGIEPELVDPKTPGVKLVREPPLAMKPEGAVSTVTLADLDGDGDLDVVAATEKGLLLAVNDGGRFRPLTSPSTPAVGAAVAGDYDNDGQLDVLAASTSGPRLLRNQGNARFADVTDSVGLSGISHAAGTAAFVDADHDGDLDIFLGAGTAGGKPAGHRLLQNGTSRFTDVTAAAGLDVVGTAVGVVPTDYDNHRDVDLLVARADGAALFRNGRDGTFRDVAAAVGLAVPAGISAVTAGDVNKDTYTDFFFGRAEGPGSVAMSDGRGRFAIEAAPAAASGARAVQWLDYDNDGLLDLVAATGDGLRVFRHVGREWIDVTADAVPSEPRGAKSAPIHAFASGDLDGDGDLDLVLATASGLRVVRNEGGERQAALRVVLNGKASNRAGIGAKVEARAGSLRHKLELYAAAPAPAPSDLVFGLGPRTVVDAVRILWPSGTLQAETDLPALAAPSDAPRRAASRAIEELDRTPSSCPYLFAWNGERFAFVTDFMGGGEMGAWLAPGVRNRPDPEEYVRLAPSQLREREGRYELRVTHELEEVLYVDRLALMAVDHPAEVDVYPNEGLTDPPRPFQLHVVRGPRPPLTAVDEHGHDVLARIRARDGVAVDDFAVAPIRGYAGEHSLTLDLGATGARTRLLLTGWTEYAFSSDNVAAHQAGLTVRPPSLEVRGADGQWKTAIADIGFPVGRPQTIVVDLTPVLPAGAREVRVSTSLRVFWDEVLVDTSHGDAPHVERRMMPVAADLRWRGFSTATRRAGQTEIDFDYSRVSTAFPWKLMPGQYTRLGDVQPLLAERDDRFVVCHPGDEIALTFDAAALPALPAGWTRTFLLHVHGYSKEMNIHSVSPDVVAPLPFQAMSEYPPAAASADRGEYVDTYNTRVVSRTLPLLETAR